MISPHDNPLMHEPDIGQPAFWSLRTKKRPGPLSSTARRDKSQHVERLMAGDVDETQLRTGWHVNPVFYI